MKMREANAVLKLLYGYKLTRTRAREHVADEYGRTYRYQLVDSAGNLPHGTMGLWSYPVERIVQWIIDEHDEAYNKLP